MSTEINIPHPFQPQSERAAAILEFALVAPVILLLTLVLVGLARTAILYHRMSEVAYEGGRLASKLNGFETGAGVSEGVSCTSVRQVVYSGMSIAGIVASDPEPCPGQASAFPGAVTQHKAVHDRVNTLLALYRQAWSGSPLWSTEVRYSQVSGEVAITIRANSPLLGSELGAFIPLTVHGNLPYLAD